MTNNNTKWTPPEDILLKQGVKKHGLQWDLVKSYMKNIRSVNSLIKRWHLKLKYEESQKSDGEGHPSSEQEVEQGSQNNNLPKKVWGEHQDKKAKLLVIESQILDWEELAGLLETTVDDCKLRWRKVIYPTFIKSYLKSGGALKWSMLEDRILYIGQKKEVDWEGDTRWFLPQRTVGSIEARWRRVQIRFQLKKTVQTKHESLKQCLRRIGRKEASKLSILKPEEIVAEVDQVGEQMM